MLRTVSARYWPGAWLPDVHDAEPAFKLANDMVDRLRTAVVDNDHLEGRAIERQALESPEALADERRAVVSGNDDGNDRCGHERDVHRNQRADR